MSVRDLTLLDDTLHRASYFAAHQDEITSLKEQYNSNKGDPNSNKKLPHPKEPVTYGQHSFAVNTPIMNKPYIFTLAIFSPSTTERSFQIQLLNLIMVELEKERQNSIVGYF